MTDQTQEIIGRVGTHKRHPERLCLMHPDGEPSNWFPLGFTLDDVALDLGSHGMILRADGSVERFITA